ncbi:helix-turn-helix domain-containing protein [Dyella sp. S184]|uniref:winged helix-turn-helix domain-containing protein n=1 Tax=Dyella sp. S184 TaxID=1641862 RepID=UPI00131B4E8A|nr:helix-turn-helix domain-containing protein [Dyella sp. S184]
MAQKKTTSGIVEDAKRIAVLSTPIRIELVTAIQALGGVATVAELAMQLGRSADGLYYHLRTLVRGGLLEEIIDADARRYRLVTAPGERMRLRYKPGATANAKAVARVAASMSRLAQRDFVRALANSDTIVEGPARELWVARLRGWADPADLLEVNRLLQRLSDLLLGTRPKPDGKLVAFHWILAPIDAKPARRDAAANSAHRRAPTDSAIAKNPSVSRKRHT